VLRSGWLCDDCWFSIRPAQHLVMGHGLRFNVAERVQSFTNPLWTLLIAALLRLGLEPYRAAIGLGVACSSLAALVLAARVAPSFGGALLGVLLLAASKAFVDYATSGLENSLGYLLYAALIATCAAPSGGRWRVPLAGLLAALLACTRLDSVLLSAPPLLLLFAERPSLRQAAALLAGALPLFTWELFSLAYYGALVPNTALAKLSTAPLTRAFLLHRGLGYLLDPLPWDPLTFPAIALGLAAALLRRRPRELALAVGIGSYLAYVVWVGGDFMAGRFLALPFLGAAALLLRALGPRPGLAGLCAVAALAASLASPRSPLRPGSVLRVPDEATPDKVGEDVADERMCYAARTGFYLRLAQGQDLAAPEMPATTVPTVGRIHSGLEAWLGGPAFHAVQYHGLSDALVVRMPPTGFDIERAGHAARVIPRGYLETLRTGVPSFADPRVAELYADVARVTRGPLWTRARWEAIGRLHSGRYDYLLESRVEADP